jgi:hypothetical protein
MADSEIPDKPKNEHTEIIGSTKLTVKERFYSYMRSHAPFAQILLNLFTLGAVECLLGQVPIPLFKIFEIFGLPLVAISVAGFLFMAFCDYLVKSSRKR